MRTSYTVYITNIIICILIIRLFIARLIKYKKRLNRHNECDFSHVNNESHICFFWPANIGLDFCPSARRLHFLFCVPGANHGWNGWGGQACKDARTKDWCQLSCISWLLMDCVLAFYLTEKALLWDYVDLESNRGWWFWCWDVTGLLGFEWNASTSAD